MMIMIITMIIITIEHQAAMTLNRKQLFDDADADENFYCREADLND